MSRKWARMVKKNSDDINVQRKRHGRNLIHESKPDVDTFKGRSWMLPVIAVGISLFFMISMGEVYDYNGMYWFTVISYFVLGAFFFLLRRPYLKIGKSTLATRRFGGEKTVKAVEVEKIMIQSGYIIIQIKERKMRWVFSRLFQLINIERTAERLKKFAQDNNVQIDIMT
jgi:hypothetical protein